MSDDEQILEQLRFHGLRFRLGLANCSELRQVADAALNAGIYSPSLVDAALDAEAWLWEIGIAFQKALSELSITLPDSKEECCWEVLRYHIEQIASQEIEPFTGLQGIMQVYYGCRDLIQSNHSVGDSHDIHELVGAYWSYDDLIEGPQEILTDEDTCLELDQAVVEICQAWLNKHSVSRVV